MLSKKLLCLTFLVLFIFGTFIGNARVSAQDAEDDDVEVFDDFSADKQSTQATPAATEDEDDFEEDASEENLTLNPSADIVTKTFFPEFTDKKFPLGEEVSFFVNVHNAAVSEAYNVTFIAASLHSAIDYSFQIQNFSAFRVGQVVNPTTQMSIEYRFKADAMLEPVDFFLTGFIVYNNTNDKMFRTIFFNETVSMYSKGSQITLQLIFTYIMLFAMIGAAAYSFYNYVLVGKLRLFKSNKPAKVESQEAPKWETTQYAPRATSIPANKVKKNKSA